ncbi:MAG: SAM-dependent methyltransferase [Natronomonas sp.]
MITRAVKDDRQRWDDRYRDADFELPADPSPVLVEHVGDFPSGRALDVATGTGRNALFLAEGGFAVDAIDVSRVALDEARQRAHERSLSANWIQTDFDAHCFPPNRYAVVAVALFDARDRLDDLKDALRPGGVLVYDHHLRTPGPYDHGPSDRYRFAPGELRAACEDMTILHYAERPGERADGERATVELVARKE